MSFGFDEIIRSIEAEIRPTYIGGAIRWADENKDFAWSKAIDRFERALLDFMVSHNYEHIRRESHLYKKSILELLAEYKRHKNIDDKQEFLKSLLSVAS